MAIDEKQLFAQIIRDLSNPFVEEEKITKIYNLYLSDSFSTIFDDVTRESVSYYFRMFLEILKIKTEEDLKLVLEKYFCQKNIYVRNMNQNVMLLVAANMHKLSGKSYYLEFGKSAYTMEDLQKTTLYRNIMIGIAKEKGFDKVEDYIKYLDN